MIFITIPVLFVLAYTTDVNIYLMYIIGQCVDVLKFFVSRHLLKKEKWLVNLTEN